MNKLATIVTVYFYVFLMEFYEEVMFFVQMIKWARTITKLLVFFSKIAEYLQMYIPALSEYTFKNVWQVYNI